MTASLQRVLPEGLGAPGIYGAPVIPPPRLDGRPMDVAAFVGVAPRGPSRVPKLPETWRFDRPTVGLPRRRSTAVAVESFDAYRRLYGGFDGPGRLPFAVASFFEQGGRRAYVVRVVHDYGAAVDTQGRLLNDLGVAHGALDGVTATRTGAAPVLTARDEGAWGNALRAALGFTVAPQVFRAAAASATGATLTLDAADPLAAGSLLRLVLDNGDTALRFVGRVRRRGQPDTPQEELVAELAGAPLPAPVVRAERVAGVLEVDDGTRRERHGDLGLSSRHPRWLATVLSNESALVFPAADWADADLLPDAADDLPRPPMLEVSRAFVDGADRYDDLELADLFGTPGAVLDPGAGDGPGDGIDALLGIDEVASLVVPDLYVPEPLPVLDPVAAPTSLAGATFAPCVVARDAEADPVAAPPMLPGLRLDPVADLDAIIALQQRLVTAAARSGHFVALLDVPPGLTPRQRAVWRAAFDSAYAAAYHPWLRVDRADDRRDALVLLNPSAAAAGIIAAQERRFGVAHGPANVLAAGVVAMAEPVASAEHDHLHPLGINVYRRERDGVRLTAARTLARDPMWRQLSVRRLMIMLRRVLVEQTRWMVFEPNDASLRADMRSMLRGYLGQLYRQGALRGDREDDAFRVRCDAALNPPSVVDAGRLIAEIAVAPAAPLEFIRLRLVRDGDGTAIREV